MIGAYNPAAWWQQHAAGDQTVFENLRAELRRGCLVLAVLAELRLKQHGYRLRQSLSGHGLDIEPGTLYPLLRRLEMQGLLVSEWHQDGKRKKKHYTLSQAGLGMLERLRSEWLRLDHALKAIADAPGSKAA